jgi:predicted dehydrogenase
VKERSKSVVQDRQRLQIVELTAIVTLMKDYCRRKDLYNGQDVAVYTDYDRFLEHDMDAVVLANYFHQHAPFAIGRWSAGLT